jgi:hypothetical protein
MPDIYKGMVVPRYDETADGPAAFRALVDSGPIPRCVNAAALPASPTEGRMAYNLDTNELLIYGGSPAAWRSPWEDMPKGVVARATGFTTATSYDTDIGSEARLPISYRLETGRAYMLTGTFIVQALGDTKANDPASGWVGGILYNDTNSSQMVGTTWFSLGDGYSNTITLSSYFQHTGVAINRQFSCRSYSAGFNQARLVGGTNVFLMLQDLGKAI